MASDWTDMPLPEVIDFKEGPGILAKDFQPSGVPLVRLAGLERHGSVLIGCNYLNPETVERKWSHFALAKGDILVSTSASIGRIATVDEDAVGAIPYTGIIRMRPRDRRLFAPFIRYLLEGPDFQRQAEMLGAGSVIRHFGPTHLRQMNVLVPPLAEQHAIAHVLGTFDEKIKLSRRMSETLEALALTLFQSWFVDFDPVRAKAENVDPGVPLPLADLFPPRLVDSELGQVPEGWTVKGLDEIADFLNGLALQKYPPVGGRSLPVIKISQLRAGHTVGADRASSDLDPRYVVDDGDILFSWSGTLECVLWAGARGALNQHLFKVTSERFPRWLSYMGVHAHLPEFRRIAAGKATTMGHIQRHHLSEARLAVPPEPVLRLMNEHFEPMIEALWRRQVESRTLAALREALLPKLISGELRVRHPERFNLET